MAGNSIAPSPDAMNRRIDHRPLWSTMIPVLATSRALGLAAVKMQAPAGVQMIFHSGPPPRSGS